MPRKLRLPVAVASAPAAIESGEGARSAPPCCEDRRIPRSKRALRDALIELMEERSFDGFSVNDLCERADLNRGTFYNHFRDKDDLLARWRPRSWTTSSAFRCRCSNLTVHEPVGYALVRSRCRCSLGCSTTCASRARSFTRCWAPAATWASARACATPLCTNLVQSILHERYRNDPAPFVGYYVAFFASAYLGVITRWIETGMQESSEEMALIAMRLFFIKPGESIKL